MDQRSRGGVGLLAITAMGLLLGGCDLGAEAKSSPSPTTTTNRTTAVILPQNGAAPGKQTGKQTETGRPEAGDPPECSAEHSAAVITEINSVEGSFVVVLTNEGPGPCTLSGSSDVRMFAADGQELDLNVLHSVDPTEPFSVQPDGQAAMPVKYATLPEADAVACEKGGGYLMITLPGDSTVKAGTQGEQTLPPVCGNVVAANWEAGA